eukprot:ANDGO_01977.mRNA.1 hypothetical protein
MSARGKPRRPFPSDPDYNLSDKTLLYLDDLTEADRNAIAASYKTLSISASTSTSTSASSSSAFVATHSADHGERGASPSQSKSPVIFAEAGNGQLHSPDNLRRNSIKDSNAPFAFSAYVPPSPLHSTSAAPPIAASSYAYAGAGAGAGAGADADDYDDSDGGGEVMYPAPSRKPPARPALTAANDSFPEEDELPPYRDESRSFIPVHMASHPSQGASESIPAFVPLPLPLPLRGATAESGSGSCSRSSSVSSTGSMIHVVSTGDDGHGNAAGRSLAVGELPHPISTGSAENKWMSPDVHEGEQKMHSDQRQAISDEFRRPTGEELRSDDHGGLHEDEDEHDSQIPVKTANLLDASSLSQLQASTAEPDMWNVIANILSDIEEKASMRGSFGPLEKSYTVLTQQFEEHLQLEHRKSELERAHFGILLERRTYLSKLREVEKWCTDKLYASEEQSSPFIDAVRDILYQENDQFELRDFAE